MHPLFQDTTKLTDQEIEEKITKLRKVIRMTGNPSVIHQVQLCLGNLQEEQRARYEKMLADSIKDGKLNDVIDIS